MKRQFTMVFMAFVLAACADSDSGAPPAADVVVDTTPDPGDTGQPMFDVHDEPDVVAEDAHDDVTAPDVRDDATGDVAPTDAATDTDEPPLGYALSPPVPVAPFFARHDEVFARMSGFFNYAEGPLTGRPGIPHRGALGTGNGHVFALQGVAFPLNTLHSIVGPTYERRPNFFGDYKVVLADEDGAALHFDEEWSGQSLAAPVLVTAGRADELVLETADFAPHTEGPARFCLVRMVSVTNKGPQPSAPLLLQVVANNPVSSPSAGVILESMHARVLATRFVEEGAAVTARTLALPLGALASGESVTRTVTHCAGLAPDVPPMPDEDLEALLGQTAAHYRAWEAETVQFELPEAWAADFLDGMKMTLKMQTSAFGATCPMSQYTRTWLRDNIGPVMAMLAYGAFADVEAMLDYLYAAILNEGDLRNSFVADFDPALAPPAPDWESMGTLGTRVAAETPSYVVTMHGLHQRYTGDRTRAEERFGLLRRCMFAQAFGPERLLPFTDDETFRAAMNAAAGLDLEYPHYLETWSANSAALWLGAAHEFRRLAALLERPADIAEIDEVFEEVETSALDRYFDEHGCMRAFLWRDTLEPSAPFEDASLQVTWSGWKSGDDPVARDNVACLLEELGRAPGVLQSEMHERYIGMFRGGDEGVYTGMLPGYTLASLSDVGHPEAHEAFWAVKDALDSTGNLQEYHIFEDRLGLSLVYDPSGMIGDYTAKYRPWEGGIVAEAVLRYLVGFAPDVEVGALAFRPHLPAAWPSATYRNLRAADDRFDLALTRDGADTVVVLTSRGERAWDVTFRFDADGPTAPAIYLDGAATPTEDLEVIPAFDRASVVVAPQSLRAGGRLEYRIALGE